MRTLQNSSVLLLTEFYAIRIGHPDGGRSKSSADLFNSCSLIASPAARILSTQYRTKADWPTDGILPISFRLVSR